MAPIGLLHLLTECIKLEFIYCEPSPFVFKEGPGNFLIGHYCKEGRGAIKLDVRRQGTKTNSGAMWNGN